MKNALTAVCLLSLVALVGCGQQKGGLASDQSNNSSIIGGKAARAGSMIASVTVAILDLRRGASCTASILSNSIVLTAAHCVEGGRAADYRVVFDVNMDNARAVQRKVTGFKYHVKWSRITPTQQKDLGDIAVLRFEGGLPAGYRVAPILKEAAAIKNGASALLAGYGLTDGINQTGAGILRYVSVKIQDAAFSSTEVSLNQRQGRGACHGDSGGPAYVLDSKGNLGLFGITSRGEKDPLDTCGVEAVYTNMLAYKNWITVAANKLAEEAKARQGVTVADSAPAVSQAALGF
jgi:secreted trypsin-like serine protease